MSFRIGRARRRTRLWRISWWRWVAARSRRGRLAAPSGLPNTTGYLPSRRSLGGVLSLVAAWCSGEAGRNEPERIGIIPPPPHQQAAEASTPLISSGHTRKRRGEARLPGALPVALGS